MRVPVADAVAELEASGLRGRGGAGFPFSRKLATAARRGATVVVTLSEGEPASLKDAVLALTRPHLILDGAAASALTVGAKQVHVVLPRRTPGGGRRHPPRAGRAARSGHRLAHPRCGQPVGARR